MANSSLDNFNDRTDSHREIAPYKTQFELGGLMRTVQRSITMTIGAVATTWTLFGSTPALAQDTTNDLSFQICNSASDEGSDMNSGDILKQIFKEREASMVRKAANQARVKANVANILANLTLQEVNKALEKSNKTSQEASNDVLRKTNDLEISSGFQLGFNLKKLEIKAWQDFVHLLGIAIQTSMQVCSRSEAIMDALRTADEHLEKTKASLQAAAQYWGTLDGIMDEFDPTKEQYNKRPAFKSRQMSSSYKRVTSTVNNATEILQIFYIDLRASTKHWESLSRQLGDYD